MSTTIDTETMPPETTAIALRETGGAVGKAMSVDELKESLAFVKQIMREVMVEGQDYGKIPGCGDKPTLLQPGAQKLCMTFRFTDQVKTEKVTDLAGYHREYSFVVSLTSANGRCWEGVGTCSTLEAKYRYRSSNRKCPKCHKETVFKSKQDRGGWYCWAKKGGCGAQWPDGAQEIENQSAERVEHENPADYWNTVRKMAFKRALVHAAINATNTSELWTQDVEDMPQAQGEPPQEAPGRAGGASKPTRKAKDAPTPTPATQAEPKSEEPKADFYAKVLRSGAGTPDDFLVASAWAKRCLAKFIAALTELNPAGPVTAAQVAREAGWLLETEVIQDLPPKHAPLNQPEFNMWMTDVRKKLGLPPQGPATPNERPARQPEPAKSATGDDEEWRDFIVPIPPKGMKRDVYLKNPDTIGSLFTLRHGNDDVADEARRRLWGFVNHFEPKGWTKNNGQKMPPSDTDKKFREALDVFAEWFEINHPGEKL